ncbi:MAG: 3-deoxy-7-phosphoheptulonate synthase [Candidatus Omnitrophica bacterium]|nr:3-deoxy-7-phosphoheptulonate synthase [Candidatus Omnitrophota bacterium]
MKDISLKDRENNLCLVTRADYKRSVKAADLVIEKKGLTVMAGPCTVESKDQIFDIARAVKEAGAAMLRGGVFKPLTFPYGDPLAQPDSGSSQQKADRKRILSKNELFQKAEIRLGYLKEAGQKYGLPVISEILYADSIDMMSEYVDMFQIGYRHMFNMDLIEVLAKASKSVMIKRHYGESLRSLLGVAEHFEARGKHDFVFCERGVSVPHTHNIESRAVLDIQAIPALDEYAPSVPVIIDPSHATFKRRYVEAMSLAAIAAGASGLLIEVHPDPDKAWVDPLQALGFKDFEKLMKKLNKIKEVIR